MILLHVIKFVQPVLVSMQKNREEWRAERNIRTPLATGSRWSSAVGLVSLGRQTHAWHRESLWSEAKETDEENKEQDSLPIKIKCPLTDGIWMEREAIRVYREYIEQRRVQTEHDHKMGVAFCNQTWTELFHAFIAILLELHRRGESSELERASGITIVVDDTDVDDSPFYAMDGTLTEKSRWSQIRTPSVDSLFQSQRFACMDASQHMSTADLSESQISVYSALAVALLSDCDQDKWELQDRGVRVSSEFQDATVELNDSES